MKNITEITFTVSGKIRIAQMKTAESANLSSWRITNKRDRALQEFAKAILPKGYVIATEAELHKKCNELYKSLGEYNVLDDLLYPVENPLFPRDNKLRIYCVYASLNKYGRANLSVVAI